MKFFIDTANVEDIRSANELGVVCGVTTNPSLIAKEGRDFTEVIKEIAAIVDGPISGEVKATTTDWQDMIAEAREIAKIHPNMVVKIPMTEDGLKAVLARSGFTSVDAYRDTVYLNKLITAAVKKATTFSDEEVQKYYDSWEPKATAQHILIGVSQNASDDEKAEAKKKAEDLIKQLKDGADFDTLAKENSTDKSSAENGGKIGPFKRSDMVKEFADAAYGLKVGEITEEPVLTQYGYHVIKLVDKPEKGSLSDVRSTLEDELLAEKLKDTATIHSVVSSLVKSADVKITDDTLKNALKDFSDNTPNVTEQSQTTGN